MDFAAIGGPLISAGASLLGSKMTADSSAKAARLNAIAQAREAELSREWNWAATQEAWRREERLQKEFAQSGIQWRAADARAAGIHPALAMGAQTQSFGSSVGVPQTSPTGASPFVGSDFGSGVAKAGQDISRALTATRTEDARVDAYTKTVQDLTTQKMGMENALLAAQISKVNQPGTPPSFPSVSRKNLIDGQGNTPSSTKRHVS